MDSSKENAGRELTAQDVLCKNISMQEKNFKMSLPAHMTSDKFVRTSQTLIRQSPKLLECDRVTLMAAFHMCAADGLYPDGREATIVPYKDKAKYMPMVGGIVKKARNSGEIKSLTSQVVCQNDEYEHWIDETGEHFKHRMAKTNRGDPILTYAFAQTKDGGVYFEEIDMEQMAAIEKMSTAYNSPWKGPFKTEMMRKSALRRLLKYRVPSSTDLDEIIRRDDDMYAPEIPTGNGQPNRLKDLMNKRSETSTETTATEETGTQERPGNQAADEPPASAPAHEEIPL